MRSPVLRRFPAFLGVFLLMPILVGVEESEHDSSSVDFVVAGGHGSYAARVVQGGCGGTVVNRVQLPFDDVGGSIGYRPAYPFEFRLNGGTLSQSIVAENDADERDEVENAYINPAFAIESVPFGLGVGVLCARRDLRMGDDLLSTVSPTAHFRFGTPRLYGSVSMLEGIPLFSGGGFIDLGIGIRPNRRFSCWTGISLPGPYDKTGLLLETDLAVYGGLRARMTGRLGGSEGVKERAFSLGLDYRVSWKR
jgi:hypothetical protein